MFRKIIILALIASLSFGVFSPDDYPLVVNGPFPKTTTPTAAKYCSELGRVWNGFFCKQITGCAEKDLTVSPVTCAKCGLTFALEVGLGERDYAIPIEYQEYDTANYLCKVTAEWVALTLEEKTQALLDYKQSMIGEFISADYNYHGADGCMTGCKYEGYHLCSECAEDYFLSVDNVCSACPANCKNCTDYTTCTECKLGRGFDKDQECKICADENCYSCAANYQSCTSCVSGYTWDATIKLCVACDPLKDCETCTISGTTTTCTSCVNGKFLDAATGTCTSCDAHVEICTSLTAIVACDDVNDYGLVGTVGVCQLVTSNSIQDCKTLDTVTLGDCLTCYSGSYLHNGRCKTLSDLHCLAASNGTATTVAACSKCEDGYFLDTDTTCTSCDSGCATCTGTGVCQTCDTGYELTGTTCVQPSSNTCTITNPNYQYCSLCAAASATTCIKCVTSTSICEARCLVAFTDNTTLDHKACLQSCSYVDNTTLLLSGGKCSAVNDEKNGGVNGCAITSKLGTCDTQCGTGKMVPSIEDSTKFVCKTIYGCASFWEDLQICVTCVNYLQYNSSSMACEDCGQDCPTNCDGTVASSSIMKFTLIVLISLLALMY